METSIKETEHTETNEKAVTCVPPTKYLVIWYHEEDLDLLVKLDRHLQLLYRRLGPQIQPHYFGYPKVMPKPPKAYTGDEKYWAKKYEEAKAEYEEQLGAYHKRYEQARQALCHAVLFIPCMTNTFLERFDADMQRDATLRSILHEPSFQILPVPLQPTQMGDIAQPSLSAYEGYQFDLACVQIVKTLETTVRALGDAYFPQTPLDALFTSAARLELALPPIPDEVGALTERYLATFTPIQALLEQASVRITEVQRVAIAERTQREAAEEGIQMERQNTQRQLEEMRQQITAIELEGQASFLTKFGRLFGRKS